MLKPGVVNPLYQAPQDTRSQWDQRPPHHINPNTHLQKNPQSRIGSGQNNVREWASESRNRLNHMNNTHITGSEKTRPETPNEIIRAAKSFKIVLHGVNNYRPNSKCKVGLAIMDEKFVLRDDNQLETKKNTIVHCSNPDVMQNDTLNHTNNKIIENRQRGNNVMFEQEFNYDLNIPRYIWDYKTDVYLVFQVLEVSDKPIQGDDSKIQGSEYQLRGWALHKINTNQGSVGTGTFVEPIYGGACPRPGDNSKSRAPLAQKIEFTIENTSHNSQIMHERKKL